MNAEIATNCGKQKCMLEKRRKWRPGTWKYQKSWSRKDLNGQKQERRQMTWPSDQQKGNWHIWFYIILGVWHYSGQYPYPLTPWAINLGYWRCIGLFGIVFGGPVPPDPLQHQPGLLAVHRFSSIELGGNQLIWTFQVLFRFFVDIVYGCPAFYSYPPNICTSNRELKNKITLSEGNNEEGKVDDNVHQRKSKTTFKLP